MIVIGMFIGFILGVVLTCGIVALAKVIELKEEDHE